MTAEEWEYRFYLMSRSAVPDITAPESKEVSEVIRTLREENASLRVKLAVHTTHATLSKKKKNART